MGTVLITNGDITNTDGDVRLCKNSLYIASKYDIIALDKLCESWDAK